MTRTKKTLATTALGLVFAAAAAGTASATTLPALPGTGQAGSPNVLDGLPVGSATKLVPGAADSTSSTQQALGDSTSAIPGNPAKLLPTGNQIGPGGLLGGLPIGG
ncbi:hypothetical protein AB0M29_00870 [Streptomyces sp. NPDC051976]|uniref:hypothetical protein n=1 Tax=Streptomyces sp. NPDC051976 TaxID=3154947 RepID=UPI0034478B41